MPQLNITIDTLTNMLVVEEHYPFTANLHASLSDLLGPPREIACAALAEILAPPVVCKRCYHKHVWPDRQSARKPRQDAADEPEERTADDDIDTDTLLRNRTL